MGISVGHIIEALSLLGGEAHLKDIEQMVVKLLHCRTPKSHRQVSERGYKNAVQRRQATFNEKICLKVYMVFKKKRDFGGCGPTLSIPQALTGFKMEQKHLWKPKRGG